MQSPPRISTADVAPWLGPKEPPVTRPMKMGESPSLVLLLHEEGEGSGGGEGSPVVVVSPSG